MTLTKIFAKEFAAKGVTVNAVAPGPMESPIVHSVVPDEKIEQFIQNIPVKALGSMEFIAETCALLASPNAHFVTGATGTLMVDYLCDSPAADEVKGVWNDSTL